MDYFKHSCTTSVGKPAIWSFIHCLCNFLHSINWCTTSTQPQLSTWLCAQCKGFSVQLNTVLCETRQASKPTLIQVQTIGKLLGKHFDLYKLVEKCQGFLKKKKLTELLIDITCVTVCAAVYKSASSQLIQLIVISNCNLGIFEKVLFLD